MRDLEAFGGLGRVGLRVNGPRPGGALDVDPVAPEHQQVEVELTGTPAPSPATAGGSLDRLEPAEDAEGRVRGIAVVVADVDVRRRRCGTPAGP